MRCIRIATEHVWEEETDFFEIKYNFYFNNEQWKELEKIISHCYIYDLGGCPQLSVLRSV